MGSDDCALCAQEVEALDHLLLGCVHNRETWFRIMHYYGMQHLTSKEELPFFEWWLGTRKQVHKLQRKGFDSLALLVVWSLWNERNRRVHNRAALQPVALVPLILEEARRWARDEFAALPLLVVLGLACNPSLLLGFNLLLCFIFRPVVPNSPFFLTKNL
jgi:hypothetical protein